MAEPNRLRDQARPNVAGTSAARPSGTSQALPLSGTAGAGEPSAVWPAGASAAAATPAAATSPTVAGEAGAWSIRRVIAMAAIGEIGVLILAAIAGAIAGAVGHFLVLVGAWVVGHGALGFWLGRHGDGRRRLWAATGGLALASVIAGIVLAVAVYLGIGHVEQEAAGPLLVLATMVFGLMVIVGVFGLPIVVVGAMAGRRRGRSQQRERIAAVAVGQAPLIQPIEPLTNKSTAKAALDDVELAQVTAGGAATRIVRTYPWAGGEAMLAADRARLAAIGYLVTKVERKAPPGAIKRLFYLLGAIVLLILALFGDWIIGAGVDLDASGRIRATFDLVASDHHAVPDNTAI